ncbi:MAG TPA: hypothetical protein VH724_00065 [Candidatus Angelobacter sp.]|nr:hypothetical protein [Candidatus Angelobacter sp.]
MNKVIVFYVPQNFRAAQAPWVPASMRGRILEFHASQAKKSA